MPLASGNPNSGHVHRPLASLLLLLSMIVRLALFDAWSWVKARLTT